MGRSAACFSPPPSVTQHDVGRHHVEELLEVAASWPPRGTARRPRVPLGRSSLDRAAGVPARACGPGCAICRTASGVPSVAVAISSYAKPNTSCSTNTARSTGVSVSSTTQHRHRHRLGQLDVVGHVGGRSAAAPAATVRRSLAPRCQRAHPVQRLPGDDPHEVGARVARPRPRSSSSHRSQLSCTTSSASATLPSIS